MSFIDPVLGMSFVHVSKTSAVVEWTWRAHHAVVTNCGEQRQMVGPLWIGACHDTAMDLARLRADLWMPTLKVGFVRNPWAWWLSAYHWYNMPRHRGFDFEEKYPTFREFILQHEAWRPRFPWDGYSAFLCDRDGGIMVDFVGHTERLQQDFDTICERTGFPRTILPTKTERRNYRDAYDAETKQIVAKHLSRRDIEIFGLTFEDGGDC